MHPWTFTVLALAAHRTTVLTIDDLVPFGRFRDWLHARFPYADDQTGSDPAGRGEATVVWFGRRWACRHRDLFARLARLWKNSWGDRIAARLAVASKPGQTKLGYLFTCPWCMGMWHAAGWFAAHRLAPAGTLQVATVAALSTVIGVVYRWGNE